MSSNVQFIDEHQQPTHGRKLADALYQTAGQLLTLIDTRFSMLQAEMKERIAAWKASAPMVLMGGMVAATSFLILTGALITLIAKAFAGSPWALFFSFLIVGVLYAICGFALLFSGMKTLREKSLVPERTIRILKDDRVWLENEVKTHL